jgi:predicted dehydrogenase/threonine dehydrogenase-like Zn-dependent dehydrogenase
MRQILQSLSNGRTTLADIPIPAPLRNHLLISTHVSLVSAGTERMLLEFGKSSWIEKARQQPDKVRLVADKIKTDGLLPTIAAVRSKLGQPLPLGYSGAGVVLECGPDVAGFKPGDRVVSNGPHAEVVSVPANLCARIPDTIPDEEAAFAVVASIALQGIRLAEPTLGENFVVTGLGLIGLVTVQLLRANGCRVLGLDFDREKIALAERFGAETLNLSSGADPLLAAERFSRGRGVDAVLITAATKSNEPVHQAALMSRKRGRIVLVGVTGLKLSRDDFYKKELSFQVSCSYGPGRYDAAYERRGQDYPIGYVRWTAQRNFEAVLDMMANGHLSVDPLITHRFPFDKAEAAYSLILSDQPHLGILLHYSRSSEGTGIGNRGRTLALQSKRAPHAGAPRIGCIGAGGYATKVLLPAFAAAGAELEVLVSTGGISAAESGRKFGFRHASTDPGRVFSDPSIDTVVIVSRHDSHAEYVCEALRRGKNVFVEKPLALTHEQIDAIESSVREAYGSGLSPLLMIGFNRRFAPSVVKMKAMLTALNQPKTVVITVNAGAIPMDHWTQQPSDGGRIVGEGCHFVDLLRFLIGEPAIEFRAFRTVGPDGPSADTVSFTIAFKDGSVGTVHYVSTGHRSFPKERVELFCGGRILQLNNFRTLKAFGWPHFRNFRQWRQDKGANRMVSAFLAALKSGTAAPIALEEILEVSRLSIDISNNENGRPIVSYGEAPTSHTSLSASLPAESGSYPVADGDSAHTRRLAEVDSA